MNATEENKPRRPTLPLVLWCGLSLWFGCWLACVVGGIPEGYMPLILEGVAFVLSGVFAVILRKRSNCSGIAFCVTFLLLGAMLWSVHCVNLNHQRLMLEQYESKDVLLRIDEDPSQGTFGSYAHVQVFDLETRVSLATVSLTLDSNDYHYGDELITQLHFSWPRTESLLRYYQQGIVGFATLGEFQPINSSSFGAVSELRNEFVDKINITVQEGYASVEAGALVQALIMGDRTNLFTLDLYQEVKVLGLAHIVAVSGAHLVIVMSFLSLVFRAIPFSRRVKTVFQLGILFLYLVMVGFPVSCIRAACMSAISLLAFGGIRRSHALSSLGIVIIAMVCLMPSSAFSLSFLLSAFSTLGILLFMPLILSWFPPCSRRIGTWLLEPFSMTCAALLLTLPFSISSFSVLSLLAPLANVLATPLVTAMCVLGLLAFITMPLGPVGSIVLQVTIGIAEVFCTGCSLLASFPFASIPFYAPEVLLIGCMAITVVALWVVWPQSFSCALKGIIVCLVLVGGLSLMPKQGTTITMLDVGQGDAFLLQSNGASVLIDTGENEQKLYAALARLGCTHLDAVLITHADSDHAGCLAALKGVVPSDKVFLAEGMNVLSDDKAQEVVEDAHYLVGDEGVIYVNAGDYISCNAFTLEVVWPETLQEEGGNQDSICFVLKTDLNFDNTVEWSAFFCGDAEAQTVSELVESGAVGQVDVLKVAHHGAKAALTQDLTQTLHPSISLISVGAQNRYGHPSAETLSYLEEADSIVMRSDRDGDVVCSFTPEEIQVQSLR